MSAPKISRPKLPKGYVDNPISEVPWEHVEKRLTESINGIMADYMYSLHVNAWRGRSFSKTQQNLYFKKLL